MEADTVSCESAGQTSLSLQSPDTVVLLALVVFHLETHTRSLSSNPVIN